MPRVVSQEEALQHDEVRKRLERGIASLKAQTLTFLDRICESRDQLPYSLLYTARTLHDALAKRFPGFPEKDLLKVIKQYDCELLLNIRRKFILKHFLTGHWKCGLLPLHQCSYCSSRCL
jgi:hypothetical protein